MKFSQSGSQNGVYTSQEKLILLGFHKRLTLILSCSVHFRSISHVTYSDFESFQCLTNLFLQVWRGLLLITFEEIRQIYAQKNQIVSRGWDNSIKYTYELEKVNVRMR